MTPDETVLDGRAAALTAYEAFAPFYDLFTADYRHDEWTGRLLDLASELGVSTGRLFDVGCGTGKSFETALRRGFQVSACDLSPAMVGRARERLPEAPARVFVADMRELPATGGFQLVTCLDDAVNYLLEQGALQAALSSMAGALAPGGLLIFDANTLRTYRETFSSAFVLERDGTLMCWWGRSSPDVAPGAICRASIEVVAPARDGLWSRVSTEHVQRHRTAHEIHEACEAAGLVVELCAGQSAGGVVDEAADEGVHPKLILVARKAGRSSRGERRRRP